MGAGWGGEGRGEVEHERGGGGRDRVSPGCPPMRRAYMAYYKNNRLKSKHYNKTN